MKAFPTSTDALGDYAPDELKELCRVLNALLQFCGDLERDSERFDRDELGIPPEDDYDDELED